MDRILVGKFQYESIHDHPNAVVRCHIRQALNLHVSDLCSVANTYLNKSVDQVAKKKSSTADNKLSPTRLCREVYTEKIYFVGRDGRGRHQDSKVWTPAIS